MLLCTHSVGYKAHMQTKTNDTKNSAHNADNGKNSTQQTTQKQRSVGGLSPDPEQAQKQLAAITPHQFKPGQSGNPNGRPKDIVKEVGKRIASARASKALTDKERKLAADLDINPDEITLLEHIMLQLATSKHPLKIALYLERTFGKVPNININAEVNAQLVTKFRSKFTDAELEDIANGANPMDMLFDKLPDVDDAPRLDDDTDYIDGDVT